MLSSYCLIGSLLVVNVLAGGYGGGGGYKNIEYDCGGTCGGGVPSSIVAPGGCGSNACEGGYNDGSYYSDQTGGSQQSSGYHRSESTVVKETNTKHLKITIGAPVVHKTTRYVSQPYVPAPQPEPVYHHPKRIHHRESYTGCDYGCDDVGGGGGGGSKIIKVIKKTTYKTQPTYQDECTTCGGGAEYVEPLVIRKVTKILKRPKIIKVVKVLEDTGDDGYDSGYGGSQASAGAYAYASSGGRHKGRYRGGGDGGGRCKFGCDEWKKKK